MLPSVYNCFYQGSGDTTLVAPFIFAIVVLGGVSLLSWPASRLRARTVLATSTLIGAHALVILTGLLTRVCHELFSLVSGDWVRRISGRWLSYSIMAVSRRSYTATLQMHRVALDVYNRVGNRVSGTPAVLWDRRSVARTKNGHLNRQPLADTDLISGDPVQERGDNRPPMKIRRLFYLPHAGGGAWSAGIVKSALSAFVEVCGIDLPGRGSRRGQPCLTRMSELVPVLSRDIEARACGEPYALLGHSMGALLSFEIARGLRASGASLPSILFIVASGPPQARTKRSKLLTLSDESLWSDLARKGAIATELLHDQELRRFLVPLIRADLEVCEEYNYIAETPLDVPISVLTGVDDIDCPFHAVEQWRQQTTSSFTLRRFPGGHFFLASALPDVARAIIYDLSRLSPPFAVSSDYGQRQDEGQLS